MMDRINISPKEWGPKFWDVMYYVALTYPTNPTQLLKDSARDFYKSLGHLLPCQTCRHHYNEILHRNPIDQSLDSRYSLTAWVVMVNNTVNERQGKSLVHMNDILDKYFKDDVQASPQPISYVPLLLCLLLLIIIIVAIVFLMLKYRKRT